MIFSHPGSSKMVSRDVLDSAQSSAWGESRTGLAGIRITTTVIPKNVLVFLLKSLSFIQEFNLSLKIHIFLFFISILTSLCSNSKMTRETVFTINNEN